jgi:tetratricopeptide (TPR) repeat protein
MGTTNSSQFGTTTDIPVSIRQGTNFWVTVLDENKKPLQQQALIRLTNQSTGMNYFQTSKGAEAKLMNIPLGTYLLEVGAPGYVAAHLPVTINTVDIDFRETVTLARDPAAVELKLQEPDELPAKARKEAEKGLQELQLSNLSEARKHLEAANRSYGNSSSLNFLLGYLALQQKDPAREFNYLTTAIKLNPRNLQAQNLLGQFYYQRGQYAHAAEAEEVVVAKSPDTLVARKVLANSYLKLKNYEKAREHAQWMANAGGSETAAGRLILGQALAGLQKDTEAIAALNGFLEADPNSSVAPQVRDLIAQIKEHASAVANSKAISDPDLAETASSANLGMPVDIDSVHPAVVSGVACPANLMDMISATSVRLVDNVAKFTAVEHMVHEGLSAEGTPHTRETRDFNYVAAITESDRGGLNVDEFRDAENNQMPDKITTTGLPVLAIAFHPLFRPDFDMQCEGLGPWEGRPTWLVHIRQLDDRPVRLRVYLVNKVAYPVRLKGRAWILPDSYQIVHLETDLVRPIPEIHLETEHTAITYGPVEFKRSNTDLWLPKSADLYVHLGKRRFHRSESFDHFMLFATDATDQPKLPKTTENPSKGPGGGQ